MKLPFKYLPGQDTPFSGTITKLFILGIDIFTALISFSFALTLTDNLELNRFGVFFLSWAMFVLLLLRGIAFFIFKTYLIIIRYVGIKDGINIALAVVTSSAAFYLATLLFPGLLTTKSNLAIILVDTVLLILLNGGFRIALRLAADAVRMRTNGSSRINTVIFGAGELGAQLQQVLKQNVNHNYRVVAFLDDNPKVHKKQLNGVPIYNFDQNLKPIIKRYDIKTAIIAIGPSLSEERRVDFINQCLEQKVRVMKVPVAEAWFNNSLEVGQLRKIRFEDLLNRPPIDLDKEAIRGTIAGKTVLVTGCAGSIGKEIVKQCLRFEPRLVIGADIAETPLAETALSLGQYIKKGYFRTVIADVRDEDRMQRLFEEYHFDYVFHAAAYKHVPIMERFPEEAIKANVQGTYNLARLASAFEVPKFVMVSTDKAVNPSNVMGASKRIAELYVQSLNNRPGNTTQFITTRFGNVLGSNGSVIPIFKRQIERRKPVTVTHPEITRYFMTIPEACQLVLEAGAIGQGGEIFIFDMGEPVRIVDLAEKMIKMAGLTPNQDITIQFTGLRPGEKLYEELLDKDENNIQTHHPKIKIASVRQCDHQTVNLAVLHLINLARNGAAAIDIVRGMKELIPEYTSLNSSYTELDKERANG